MNWQLVSFCLLTLALGAGMLWYERSRPPSQIVALVAVLAALAVAGRIVLAPIPNVVATTDIVLIAGYVLGPAPGFAVGAIGGLVSNFWLGQGAWTPWQMLGWGLAGIAGAVLWRVTAGRAGRFTLAIVCGLVGLAFGALMNLQTMVSYGGEMSLTRYLALEVRAVPFDLAHMTGNILFALAAGPAMIAALRRFRERFEWRAVTQPLGVGLIALSLGVVLFGGAAEPARAAETPQEAADGAAWLRKQQNSDGGFPSSVGGDSALTFTARAMLALAAAKINPLDVKQGDKTPYDYLVARRKEIDRPNEIALTILALHASGRNPHKFQGRDLMEALRVRQGKNGSFVTGSQVGDVNVTAWAALAFRAGGADPAADRAVEWLYKVQNTGSDGGWGIAPGALSDPDSTGTALMAIPRKAEKRVRQAIDYLRDVQKSSGGFFNTAVNSQSTSLVILGLVAAGRSPDYLKYKGNSALDFLRERQRDDGSVWYSKESDQTRVWVTADAVPAFASKPPPIAAPPRAPKPAPKPESGGGSGGGTGGTGGGGTTYNPGPPSSSSPSPSSSGPGSSSGNGSGGNGSSSGNPSPPSSDSGAPPATGEPTLPVPAVTPVVPSEALLAASAPGPSPSPLLAILICLVVSAGLCGGTIGLARHFRW